MAYSQAVFAQIDISGIYVDDSRRQIEIYGNRIVLSTLRYDGYHRYYMDDVYFKADYEWVNDKFIRLCNIKSDYPLAEIKYLEGKRKHASNVKVTVILPDIEGRKIYVRMSYFSLKDDLLITQQEKYDNKNNRATFFIPLDQVFTNLQVRPKQLYPLFMDRTNKLYNSYIQYDTSLYLDLENGTSKARAKDIQIVIPGIDDDFFGRYYVNGDYVRVDGDKLYWRGRVFIKSTKPEDIEYIEKKKNVIVK